jgi:hypothetical protein
MGQNHVRAEKGPTKAQSGDAYTMRKKYSIFRFSTAIHEMTIKMGCHGTPRRQFQSG